MAAVGAAVTREQMIATLILLGWEPRRDISYSILGTERMELQYDCYHAGRQEVLYWGESFTKPFIRPHAEYCNGSPRWKECEWHDVPAAVVEQIFRAVTA